MAAVSELMRPPPRPFEASHDSLEDMENLPPPDVIAQEIVEDLEAALNEFAAIAESLGSRGLSSIEEIAG
jgi:hypothetical protein